jgi:hypothetical protein
LNTDALYPSRSELRGITFKNKRLLVFKFLSSKNYINIGPNKLKNNAQTTLALSKPLAKIQNGLCRADLNQSLDKMAASFAKA